MCICIQRRPKIAYFAENLSETDKIAFSKFLRLPMEGGGNTETWENQDLYSLSYRGNVTLK